MTTVYNIIVDLVDYMGGFFEYVFVPPFLREYDIQYQNATRALEKRQIIERIEKAIEQLTAFITQAQQNIKTGTVQLAALDEEIKQVEAKAAACAREGKSVREAERLRTATESLKHEYRALSTVAVNQSTIVSTTQISLTQLKSNHALLSGADVDSSLLLSKDSLTDLLMTIRTKSNAQSLQHTIQVLGSLYLTGDAVTDENVRLRSAAYDS